MRVAMINAHALLLSHVANSATQRPFPAMPEAAARPPTPRAWQPGIEVATPPLDLDEVNHAAAYAFFAR